MTRELLEQYPDICAEIRELQKEHVVSDTVSASSSEFPYNQYTVTVRGIAQDARSARLPQLLRRREEIDGFIDGLERSKERRVLVYRIKHGMRWRQVAAKMGHRYSEESVKKIYQRILRKTL